MAEVQVVGIRVEQPANQPVLLLREAAGDRFLPIWIGPNEANAIILEQQGVEPRHLRAFRSAADRQSDLIAQIAGPVGKAGKTGARDRADDLAREVAALTITLHTSLIKSAVRDALDR